MWNVSRVLWGLPLVKLRKLRATNPLFPQGSLQTPLVKNLLEQEHLLQVRSFQSCRRSLHRFFRTQQFLWWLGISFLYKYNRFVWCINQCVFGKTSKWLVVEIIAAAAAATILLRILTTEDLCTHLLAKWVGSCSGSLFLYGYVSSQLAFGVLLKKKNGCRNSNSNSRSNSNSNSNSKSNSNL